MINNYHTSAKLSLYLFPYWATGLFAIILGVLMWHNPSFPFLQAKEEALNLLASRNFFAPLYHASSTQPVFPYQNLNFLRIALAKASAFLPIQRWFVDWFAQTFLFLLFLRLLYTQSLTLFDVPEQKTFLTLLVIHPLLWLTFLLYPTQSLTATLFILALSCQFSIEEKPLWYCLSIITLSFSGVWGLYLAIILTLHGLLFFLPRISLRQTVLSVHPVLGTLPAVFPSLMIFILFSVVTHSIGGPAESQTPTLLSKLSVSTLLIGNWGIQFKELLLYIGNGLVQFPFFIPIYGFLLLCGIVWLWKNRPRHHAQCLFWMGVAGLTLFLFAFIPIFSSKEWMILPFLLFTGWVTLGLTWLINATQFPFLLRQTLLIGFAFLWLGSQVWIFPSQIQKAKYNHTIQIMIHNSLDQIADPRATIAIQYNPWLFAHLPQTHTIIPLGLKITAPILFTSPEREIGTNYPLFSHVPDQIILYPSRPPYGESQKANLDYYDPLGLVSSYYTEHQNYGLRIYNLDETKRPIAAQKQREAIPLPSNTYNTPSWAIPPDGSHSPSLPALGSQVGISWPFEQTYNHVVQTGLAFGLVPDHSTSVIGQGCAGPGAPGRESLLGTLESEPFTIEGDDLRFYASIPKSCTANIFCLAVYQTTPLGPENSIHQVRPVFEHEAGDPLLGNTFYYVKPSQLNYSDGWIKGWRVIHLLQNTNTDAWTPYNWALDGWKNQQAIWFAADRDRKHSIRLDHITQIKRIPGYYWNFEDGTYDGWAKTGAAFGEKPAIGRYGNQTMITGYEGNYFINSYFGGSDIPQGTLTSPPFLIPSGVMSFRIGGGNASNLTYFELLIDNQAVLRTTGEQSEHLRLMEWDLTPWAGKLAQIRVVDHSSQPWGHILVDDIRMVVVNP